MFDAAYCGSLQRQRDTAALVLAAQGAAPAPVVDPRLNEVRTEEHLEHLLPIVARQRPEIQALVDTGFSSSKQYQKIIEAVFNYWVSPECRVEGIQSWSAYAGGVRDTLDTIMREQGAGKSTAVFTSGGTIATFLTLVLGVPASSSYAFYEPLFNCSVTQLFYNSARVSLSYFNDCSFLRVSDARHGQSLVTYR
jgi:broad specificity phosphatase PhoE